MTAYSIMSTAPDKHALLATWPTVNADRTIRVTTLPDAEAARALGWELSALSENAWLTRMWLRCAPEAETYIEAVAAWLRGTGGSEGEWSFPEPVSSASDAEADGFFNLRAQANFDLPYALTSLTRAQRIAVADELLADAAARTATYAALAAGEEPTDQNRGWQAFEVGRVTGVGLRGYALDAGPGWLQRHWPNDDLMGLRWSARAQLLRMEQLAAACSAAGGRGSVDDDPVEARCHFPPAGTPCVPAHGQCDDWHIHPGGRNRFSLSASTKLIIRRNWDEHIEVDANDDAGFIAALGTWAAGAGGSWWQHDAAANVSGTSQTGRSV